MGTLPVAETRMTAKAGTVLCVDDEPNIVRALQWLLQKEFEVLTATSGQDALQLVREHDFDVVISDQRMPGMTGVELLREIRSLSPRTMRILLTGYSDYQAILRSVNESEVFRFINKPWNISELPKIVGQAAQIARAQPVLVEPEIADDAPIVAGGDSILLIDDDAEMLLSLREAVGEAVTIRHANRLADAVAILNEQPISVIVSETAVGRMDATRLVRLMKQKHPEIVTIMLTGDTDADTVTSLINQGQIYRFVPKPIRPGYLKLVVNSALAKHRQLRDHPVVAARHAVQSLAVAAVDPSLAELQLPLAAAAPAAPPDGFFDRLVHGLKRLLGR